MREEKIKELQQEKTKHIILFILNTLMTLSQIFIIINFCNSLNSLMIFGCIGIAFGTGLNALVRFLQICDTKKSLETYGE